LVVETGELDFAVTRAAVPTEAVDGGEVTFVVFVGFFGVVEFPEAVDELLITPAARSVAVTL
jgi:hypothetical protein